MKPFALRAQRDKDEEEEDEALRTRRRRRRRFSYYRETQSLSSCNTAGQSAHIFRGTRREGWGA